MIFHINKKSTLPLLKIKASSYDNKELEDFNCGLQNANITFSLYKTDCSKPIFKCRPVHLSKSITQSCTTCPQITEYQLTYQFTEKDTANKGLYKGVFNIEFLDGQGNIQVPMNQDLIINVR